tara:strand:- start:3377 stop:4057 length:681 start_codon:yes stop_codon:yes gene_type:complete
MTFENQINNLTGLTLGTHNITSIDQATQFLQDGVREVINRIIKLDPAEIPKFCKTTHDNSDAGVIYTGKVYSVVRQHDSATVVRPCDLISADIRFLANDDDSIYYRSKYNPAYYITGGIDADGSKIYSIPGSGGENNDLIVTQVHYDTGLATTDEEIDNFPTEYTYLVPLYAAIKVVEQKVSKLTALEEDVEIASGLAQTLAVLKGDYEGAFNRMASQAPSQGERS